MRGRSSVLFPVQSARLVNLRGGFATTSLVRARHRLIRHVPSMFRATMRMCFSTLSSYSVMQTAFRTTMSGHFSTLSVSRVEPRDGFSPIWRGFLPYLPCFRSESHVGQLTTSYFPISARARADGRVVFLPGLRTGLSVRKSFSSEIPSASASCRIFCLPGRFPVLSQWAIVVCGRPLFSARSSCVNPACIRK